MRWIALAIFIAVWSPFASETVTTNRTIRLGGTTLELIQWASITRTARS